MRFRRRLKKGAFENPGSCQSCSIGLGPAFDALIAKRREERHVLRYPTVRMVVRRSLAHLVCSRFCSSLKSAVDVSHSRPERVRRAV
jgi:hypothetical protein